MVWYGIWFGLVWFGSDVIWYGTWVRDRNELRETMALMSFVVVCRGILWNGMVNYGTATNHAERMTLVSYVMVCRGVCGMEWFGLVWFGMVWSRNERSGANDVGVVCRRLSGCLHLDLLSFLSFCLRKMSSLVYAWFIP